MTPVPCRWNTGYAPFRQAEYTLVIHVFAAKGHKHMGQLSPTSLRISPNRKRVQNSLLYSRYSLIRKWENRVAQ